MKFDHIDQINSFLMQLITICLISFRFINIISEKLYTTLINNFPHHLMYYRYRNHSKYLSIITRIYLTNSIIYIIQLHQ